VDGAADGVADNVGDSSAEPSGGPSGGPSDRPEGLAYHELHRVGRTGWAWSLLGVCCVVVLLLGVSPTVLGVLFLAVHQLSGSAESSGSFADRMNDTDPVTPVSLAYVNLGLGAAIVVVMLVTWAVHGLRPAWVASVRPRVRWRWLLACVGLSVVALLVTVLVSSLLPIGATGDTAAGSRINDVTSTTRDFLLVIVILTPLQAVGEEYLFRGYLTQAVGSVLGSRVVAVVVPALLFAVAHGTQELPIFLDRFAFGVIAGVLVIATGGLEAGIAMHVLNNFLAFGLALAFGDMTEVLSPAGASWWNLPVTLTRSLVYVALVLWLARRWGLGTRARPLERADFAPGRGSL